MLPGARALPPRNSPLLTKVAIADHYQMKKLLIGDGTDMAEATSTDTRLCLFMDLPTEVRLKIYAYVIHDPAAIIELVGPHEDCEASHFWEQEDDWEDIEVITASPRPTSILLACRKCYDEGRHLVHQSISLSVKTFDVILPFLTLIGKRKRDRIKHVFFYMTGEHTLVNIGWQVALHNLESIELSHSGNFLSKFLSDDQELGNLSRAEEIKIGREVFEKLNCFVMQCKKERSFKVYIRIKVETQVLKTKRAMSLALILIL
jgi:hypothetical protein